MGDCLLMAPCEEMGEGEREQRGQAERGEKANIMHRIII